MHGSIFVQTGLRIQKKPPEKSSFVGVTNTVLMMMMMMMMRFKCLNLDMYVFLSQSFFSCNVVIIIV